MERIRLRYAKSEEVRFIGHLDVVRLWERALRRTDLPCAYSEGFNPRQKMSFGPPLPFGFTSECELLDIGFERWISAKTVMDRLNAALPSGIKILEAKNVLSAAPAISAALRFAEYKADCGNDLSDEISAILAKEHITVRRKDKDVDIRPMIKHLSWENGVLSITVQCDNFGSVKGDEIKGLFASSMLSGLKRTLLA